MTVLRDIPQDEIVKCCNAVAYLYNRLAPLFKLEAKDEHKLTDYLLDTVSGFCDRLPEK